MSLELSYLDAMLSRGKFAQGMRGLRVGLNQTGQEEAGWGDAAAGINAAATSSQQQRCRNNRQPQ